MFNVGDAIVINPELCPENKKDSKKNQFGSLNYAVLMLDWEFEVVRLFKDDYHGEMMEVSVKNNPEIKSNMVLKKADVIFAISTAPKIEFEILGIVNKFQYQIDKLIQEETKLLNFRSDLKKNNLPITAPQLVTNWNSIKSVRAKIKKLNESPEKVFSVKHRSGTYYIDCKEEEVPAKLRRAIKLKRNETNKRNIVTKIISGFTYNMEGGVLVEANRFLEINEKFAITVIKQHKTPTTNDNFVGIEIEMLSPKSIESMNKAFVKERLHRYVNIGTDASIRTDVDGVYAMELRLCLPESLLESHLKKISEVLRKNDCYANRSCGMHVHLDMRNRDPELAYRNLFKVQNIMQQTQPESRRNNKYCMPNTKDKLKLKDFDGSGGNDTRRLAINTQSYNKNNMRTIEIRIHEGATKFKDIYNWVQFLVGTVNLRTDLEYTIFNIKDLESANYLDAKTIAHLDERIQEYSA